ncbi:hypothetical protein PIB30_087428 [Stylosanthes scabra]|uniref:Protein kinase domain-containing protein n=1 Tax=Stylosanthes scabra TaxID=79078 RepID=A0ABU6YVB1_9FABA|nr:hypothetical protein [Stylosanthes scabra]
MSQACRWISGVQEPAACFVFIPRRHLRPQPPPETRRPATPYSVAQPRGKTPPLSKVHQTIFSSFCLVMGDFDFTIDVHHGRRFIDMGHGLEYLGGSVLEDLHFELDSWSLQEIVTIGKTHHKNLVRLLGFCVEGPKRLLVYEYMSNGSLGKLLFGNEMLPDWDERVRIALDIARGILYLHEECEAPIIHCDIKPQNSLMDEFWTAKISDFGLAKLLMLDQTRTFTGVRGTRGYVAPEWQKNIPISVKADVYRYGVMMLEVTCCRRNLEVSVPEEILLSGWTYRCFVAKELHKLVYWEIVDKNVLENMVKVALWCIQEEPALCPTLKSVVLMLEGVTDVAIPPCLSTSISM